MKVKEVNELEVLSRLFEYSRVARKDTVAKKMLQKFGSLKQVVDAEEDELSEFIPDKSISLISFVREFAGIYSYLSIKEGQHLSSPEKVVEFFKSEMGCLKIEKLYAMLLNAGNRLIDVVELSEGTESRSAIYPRILIKAVIQKSATGVILCHNHPGGTLKPSQNDIIATEHLSKALKTIETTLLDHIIITSDNQSFSFKEHGFI